MEDAMIVDSSNFESNGFYVQTREIRKALLILTSAFDNEKVYPIHSYEVRGSSFSRNYD